MRRNPICYSNKKIKYLGINLTKEMKDLYSEHYTTSKKEIREDTIKWKHILCSWIWRVNIIKRSILFKEIYRFSTIPNKIPMAYFTDKEQIFQTFLWNQAWPWISSTNFRKKYNVGGITFPDIKIYYKATVIKTVWYWHKNRNIDQWNRRDQK